MTWQKLDLIFPYVCFFYGALMTISLNLSVLWPALARIADDRFPAAMIAQWRSHRAFAYLCLAIGFIWVLQNIWLS